MRTFLLVASAGLFISCGAVGSPVPPDYVGVAVTIDKQNRQHAVEAARETEESRATDPSLEGQDIGLPPSRPVGMR